MDAFQSHPCPGDGSWGGRGQGAGTVSNAISKYAGYHTFCNTEKTLDGLLGFRSLHLALLETVCWSQDTAMESGDLWVGARARIPAELLWAPALYLNLLLNFPPAAGLLAAYRNPPAGARLPPGPQQPPPQALPAGRKAGRGRGGGGARRPAAAAAAAAGAAGAAGASAAAACAPAAPSSDVPAGQRSPARTDGRSPGLTD